MKLLLDTHIAVWLATDDLILTDRERAILVDPTSDLCLSVISVWEVRTKAIANARRGRDDLIIGASDFTQFYETQNIEIISLHARDCVAQLVVPIDHHDPFDEMLLVHAQRLGAKLLTRDGKLLGHPLVYQP